MMDGLIEIDFQNCIFQSRFSTDLVMLLLETKVLTEITLNYL